MPEKPTESWLAVRSGLPSFFSRGGASPVPGGASWLHTLQTLIPLLIVVQFVTGALLLLRYQATPQGAWESVQAIRTLAPFGIFISSLHHWGVSLLVSLSGLYLLATVLVAGYRPPRELTWWMSLLVTGLLMALAMTGQALPWDQKGYWGTVVILSAAEQMPLVGGLVAGLFKTGMEFGAQTLSAFAALHTVILPALLALTLVAWRSGQRHTGPAAPWWRDELVHEPYAPKQQFRDAAAFCLLVALLFALAWFSPVATGPKADPLDATYQPRPEWYFTWIFYGVRFASGGLSVLFEAGAPLVILLVFASLPLLDRRGPRSPLRRWPTLVAPLLVFAGIATLTIAGLSEPAPAPAKTAAAPALTGDDRAWAARVFRGNCADCHGLTGQGDGAYLGNLPEVRARIPVFSNKFFAQRTEEGIVKIISEGIPPGAGQKQLMPGYASLYTPEQIRTLAQFVRAEFGR